jgi:hydrogenase/urease accessory protein HupE
MKRIAASVVLFLAFGTSAPADLTNPSTLILKETSPSRFTVELTLPIIKGRVLKARPVFPDVCVIDGDAEVQGDGLKVVRTWAMTCDPNALVGKAIGVHGLLGTSVDVQLTLEMLDGRKYVSQLRPTQAYYLVPPSPTLRSMVVAVGGVAVRQVLRHPELAILLLLCVFFGLRLPGLLASAGAFATAVALGQWLKTENWIGVSSFLPVMLTAVMGLAIALSTIRGRTAAPHATWRRSSAIMVLMGVLYGGGGLPMEMVLSRSEQNLALLFSALGTMAGLALVILCAGQLHALVVGSGERTRERLQFWIAYLGGVAACAIGLYQGSAAFFVGGVTPTVPFAVLLGAIALGAWCGAQSAPTRSFLPGVAGGFVIMGMVLSLRGIPLPQTTLALNGSLALVGILLVWPLRWPGWSRLVGVALFSLYHGAHAGGILRESVALPIAQATAMIVLLVFLFLVTYHHVGQRGPGDVAVRLFGLATALLAVLWRFAEYRDWIDGEVAVEATMGLFPLPLLTIILALAALLVWPRTRRFQPVIKRSKAPVHWGLVMVALFTLPVGGCSVHNPFYTPRAPTAAEARPIMGMLLTDTYLAFNLPDEEAAFDRLARNLSEDLVPGVYLDSRRRLTAGTRKGAEVTVKDVSVMSVDAPSAFESGDLSFTYPCKWVVTARVKHWLHIHDRQNIYVGALTIRVEDDRWKISHLELLSEEREILSWQKL